MKHGFLYYTRTDFMPFATLKISQIILMCYKYLIKLDVDPQRDDDASPMSTYRCMSRPT